MEMATYCLELKFYLEVRRMIHLFGEFMGTNFSFPDATNVTNLFDERLHPILN